MECFRIGEEGLDGEEMAWSPSIEGLKSVPERIGVNTQKFPFFRNEWRKD